MEFERRAFEFSQTAAGTLEGIIVPYGVPSRIAGVFSEEFRAGAMRYGDGVLVNRQHDRAKPLARLGYGLALTDGADALRARLTLPDTVDGRDVRELVKAGVLRGFSAEFRAIAEDWPSPETRIITEAELGGIAVVDDPAHEGSIIEEVRARIADASMMANWRWHF